MKVKTLKALINLSMSNMAKKGQKNVRFLRLNTMLLNWAF